MKTRAGRERRCIVSGEVKPEAALLRVALSPDGVVTPDLRARLPGRGAWVSADRAAVEKAARKGLFNRAFERPVDAPDDLADRFEALLAERVLSLLGLARRAGRLAIGYDAARQALGANPEPAWRIEASDGARDGRRKLDAEARRFELDPPVLGCFDAETLGAAVGRPAVVHAVLASGSEARALTELVGKLAGFRETDRFRDERRPRAQGDAPGAG